MSQAAIAAAPASRLRIADLATRELSDAWVWSLIGLLGVLHLSMVFGRGINWDEFWYYSQVEQLARGEYLQPLQTIHARIFAWLPGLPGSEIGHIILARLFMLASMGVVAVSIFLVGQVLSTRRAAMLAAAMYLGAGMVLQHGTSFRVDPFAAALLSAALAVTVRTRMGWFAIAALGVLIGLVAMVSIKFVLWAPAFAGVALWRWQKEERGVSYVFRWLAAGAIAALTFAVLYHFHAMDAPDGPGNGSASAVLSNSAIKMFGLFHSPYLPFMGLTAITAIIFTFAALLVPLVVARMQADWPLRVAIAGLWFPLLTPIFYHNSAPYLYTFILPPVAMACAVSLPELIRRYGDAFVMLVLAGNALAVWGVDERHVLASQRNVLANVHHLFPQPVAYFDQCAMIGGFIKANDFRTRWGIELYLAGGRPTMRDRMESEPVPLLISNGGFLGLPLEGVPTGSFHPLDYAAIRNTYVRFAGGIYLAGAELRTGDQRSWEVLVPGTYTVHGTLVIDGNEYGDDALVTLRRGTVSLNNASTASAQIIWGDHLKPLPGDPPVIEWTGF